MLTLARCLIWLLSLIPLRALHALAVPLAALLKLRDQRKARIVRANLRIAFPEADEQALTELAANNRREMVRLLLETGAVWHWSEARLRRHIRSVEGQDVLDGALAKGRGVLMLGGHLGNWELASLYTMMNVGMFGLYTAPERQDWQQALTRSRERFGGELVAAGGPALRKLLQQLKRGGPVGMLIDQQPKQGEGRYASFFGRPALTMTLYHRLIQATGCRVVSGYCYRLPGGAGWGMAYMNAPEAVYSPDQDTAITAMNEFLADQARTYPAQYLWRYKRFSLQPEGLPNPYEHGSA
ncbi:MAG: lysophospholipid acyltransferase family protein [Pseudomonadota bacterium]